MGLDIHHYYLTNTPNNEGNFFRYLNDWNIDCNTPLKIFENFITDIEDYENDKYILILNNENDLNIIINEKMISEQEIQKYFVGNLNRQDWDSIIVKYLKENNIENVSNKITFKNDHIEYIYVPIYKKVIVKGMYYVEVGYQRKSMGDRFYDIFEKNKHWLYGKKEDFELAYDCIGGEYYIENFGIEIINEIKENFKINFIDKYIFGKSLMAVSF